jgi:hypothetical protein
VGGGLANRGRLSANHAAFLTNVAAGAGGALWTNSTSTVALSAADLRSNRATTGGGIFEASGGTAVLGGGTVRGNNAVSGGGLYNGGTLSLRAVTVVRNIASKRGGGLSNARHAVAKIHASLIKYNLAPLGANIYNQGTVQNV